MGRTGPSAFDKNRMAAAPPPSDCPSGKVAYKKKRQAKREADRLGRLANPKRRPNLRPYECVYCHRWHLTSQLPLPEHIRRPRRGREAA